MNDPYSNKAGLYAAIIDRLNRSLHSVVFASHPGERGMRVLDIGCGTGAQLVRYAAAGCAVSGVDSSPAMISKARTSLGPEADLRLADARDLPYADGEFELVVASLFIHELDAAARMAVLSEASRVLSATGSLVVVDFGAGDLTPRGRIRRFVSRLFERAAGREHFANHAAFLAAGGTPAAIAASPLRLESERLLAGGDLSVVVARR